MLLVGQDIVGYDFEGAIAENKEAIEGEVGRVMVSLLAVLEVA